MKIKWHTETRKVSELKGWEDNPRTITKEAYQELKESVENLGNFDPLVINIDGTVIAGNQRLRYYVEKGEQEVEVSVPERELTEEEIKKIGIISNRHSGEWDMDKLAEGFSEVLGDLGLDDLLKEIADKDFYSTKIEAPLYEITGDKPSLDDLVTLDRYNEIVKAIDESELGEDIKRFLRFGATRFITFDFSRIAEFFAHSSKEEQEYFIKQALVIIDYERAIELGFVSFMDSLIEIEEDEEGN
jgi:hypothetical protein